MHLAAACGVTVVALFGNANPPRVWHPYGPRHRVIQRMQGIFAIKVVDIAAAVREASPSSVDAELKLRLEDPGA
jgi:ADP-heptose:LPS heptosyltransferase